MPVSGPSWPHGPSSIEQLGELGHERLVRHVQSQRRDGDPILSQRKNIAAAGAVLRRWNITSTFDFGRIVFALIAAGQMQQTEEDSIDDFRGVFEFRTAFESDYRIPTA